MESEQLNGTLMALVSSGARVEQGLEDLHARLFNDGTGAIPSLFLLNKEQSLRQELAVKAIADALALVKLENAAAMALVKLENADAMAKVKLENTIIASRAAEKRAYSIGYGAGLGTIASLFIKFLLSKVGIYF